MRAAVVVLLSVLAAVGAAAGSGATGADGSTAAVAAKKPRPLVLRERCVTRAERRRVVRFTASDGVRLIGVELGTGPAGVVLAHGSSQDVCAWLPYGRRLAAAGYRVLVFDHRRHGSSQWPTAVARLWRVDRDAAAAVGALRRRGARTVVTVGSSMGATAVVAGAALQPLPDAVVSLSATDVFVRVNAAAAAARLSVPVLYVVAQDDGGFFEAAQRLYAATATADRRLEVFPGGDHGIDMLRDASVSALVESFIRAHSAPAP